MKLISILIVLALIAYLSAKQLNTSSSENRAEEVLKEQGIEDVKVPRVSSSPKDLQKFEKDMNKFIEDNAAKQAEELDKL